MTPTGPQSHGKSGSKSKSSRAARDRSQLDFEVDFFGRVLERLPNFIDVLRVQANNLSLKGRYSDGLTIDKRLVYLRPSDSLAHYNLACSYALLGQSDLALETLRKAVELGYRDFRFMRQDRDLESIRRDPRFRQILMEYEDHADQALA